MSIKVTEGYLEKTLQQLLKSSTIHSMKHFQDNVNYTANFGYQAILTIVDRKWDAHVQEL